jgi:hypothetical protein
MNHTCAKCGSDRIMPNVFVVDQSPHMSEGMVHDNPLRVRVQKNPDAWFFTGDFYSELIASICGDCGYTELRVRNPQELYERYLASRG